MTDLYKTGMITWGWYTWLRRWPWTGAPRIHWIDNNAFVLRKG